MANPQKPIELPAQDSLAEKVPQKYPAVESIQLKDGVAFLPEMGEGQTTIKVETDQKVRASTNRAARRTLEMRIAPMWSGVLVTYETQKGDHISGLVPMGHLKCVRLDPAWRP